MNANSSTVFVIDDEPQGRESVIALVESMNFHAKGFPSAEQFLDEYAGEPGCVVSDYRMAGMNGLELQKELNDNGIDIPMIMVTAFARTQVTVQAIQNGAVTMLDKPYNEDDLWSAIREGLQLDEKRREEKQARAEITNRLASLKDKEQEVLDLIIEGLPNKAMASRLDVSLRTIENRRRTVFAKLGTQTVAELVALVLKLRSAGGN